jgi:hypothetical protein
MVYFVAFKICQRCCCPSYGQKRAFLLAHLHNEEVLAEVPHRQWVFTVPRRLRVYFRYDRSLLGKLCHAAWETVRYVYALEVDSDSISNSGHKSACQSVAAFNLFHSYLNLDIKPQQRESHAQACFIQLLKAPFYTEAALHADDV